MKGKLHVIVGVLFVLALAYDFFLWGGLARTRQMGPLMVETTQRELALAGVYLPIGKILIEASGLQRVAAEHAQSTLAPVESRLLARPSVAMDTMVENLPLHVMLAYYGAPLLLVAFALAWWRRPREVHIGR